MREIYFNENVMLTGTPNLIDESFDHEFGTKNLSDLEVPDFKIFICVDPMIGWDEMTIHYRDVRPETYERFRTHFLDNVAIGMIEAS